MKNKSHALKNLALLSYIGISMTVPIVAGVYAGRWIDTKFDTQPLFLFVFIILGVIVAFSNLFKVATNGIAPSKRK